MAIKFKHRVTKEIAEYDSVMGLFYVEGRNFKDNGNPIPYNSDQIKNNPDWEYYEGEITKSGRKTQDSNR